MAFIRTKKIKGHDYYYLVKNQWDPIKKKSTQQIIKYLGNVTNFNINDIPEEYRSNPRILSLLGLSSRMEKDKNKCTDAGK